MNLFKDTQKSTFSLNDKIGLMGLIGNQQEFEDTIYCGDSNYEEEYY